MHSNELCLFKYKSILPKTKIEIGVSANPPIETSMGATPLVPDKPGFSRIHSQQLSWFCCQDQQIVYNK